MYGKTVVKLSGQTSKDYYSTFLLKMYICTNIITTRIVRDLQHLLSSNSQYWASTIFPKISVLALVTQSLVNNKKCAFIVPILPQVMKEG